MNRIYIFTCISSVLILQGLAAIVEIEDVQTPPYILLNDPIYNNINLTCKFNLPNDTSHLVVKWFKDNEPIYQWIRGQKPTSFPNFKGFVDEDAFTDDADPSVESSHLTLKGAADMETAGIYKCAVQTDQGTAALEKELHVIDLTNYTHILQHITVDNGTEWICVIDNVYPQPDLKITSTLTDNIMVVEPLKVHEDVNGRYNATVVVQVRDNVDLESFSCIANFKDIPLNLTQTSESGCESLGLFKMLLLLQCLFVLVRHFSKNI